MSLTTTLKSLISSVFASGQASGAITASRVASVETEIANDLDKLAPIYPSGDTSGSADTTAINSAVSAGGVVNLAPGNFYVTLGSVSATSQTGLIIKGAGRATTIINMVGSSGDCFTLSGCLASGIEAMTIQAANPASPPTSGFAIKLTGNCFESWTKDILCTYVYNAINVHNCTECRVNGKTTMRPIAGPYGVLFDGSADTGAARLVIEDIASDVFWQTAFSGNYSSVRGNWAGSTSYSVGDLAVHGANVYQCVTAGTSGGTGPTGLSFTSNSSDGGAAWRFIFNNSLTWITVDTYAGSLVVDKAALINGAYGLAMTDTGGGGIAGRAPQWTMVYDLEIDHPFYSGILLKGGAGFYCVDSWVGSCINGNGIDILSTFEGEIEIATSRMYGNAGYGVLIGGPMYGGISRCCVSTNSVKSPGTLAGIGIGSNVSNFSIQNNFVGATTAGGANFQSYGILLASGTSDHYQITNNNCPANVTAAVFDGGSGSNKVVSGNTA